jgi:lauroyl/myristoyl acyltransferase
VLPPSGCAPSRFRANSAVSGSESSVLYLLRPIERHLRRSLDSELDRRRFDRAKRFVDDAVRRGGGYASGGSVSYRDNQGFDYNCILADKPLVRADEMAHRLHARWLKFLCSRAPVQRDVWPEHVDFLHRFAAAFGLPPAELHEFVALSLLGRVWRAWCYRDLVRGRSELVVELTRVEGWERLERSRRNRTGLILLMFHSQFSRLFQPCLRHRGYDGLEVGLTNDKLERRGFRTPAAKQFELARQMHEAKRKLAQGGLVVHLPDARENLENARSVEFFGRERRLATAFAELAVRTGADVVPIAYRFSPRGFFVLDVGERFDVPGPESSHDDRIDSLVTQYAEYLRNEWRRYPWNIHWDHLRYYCELPEVGTRKLGEKVERVPAPRPAEFSLGAAK